MTARNYPLPQPAGDDPRFTFGLVLDVAAVLVRHGYPVVDGVDFVDLRSALFRFAYAAEVVDRDRQFAAEIAERVSADADPTPAEVMESLHAIFTGPVEGRDYHVMPENTAPVQDEDQPLAARGHSQDDNERHAMIPDAERGDDPRARIEIPRCGAPYRGFGTVALFAAGVTCPTCLTMLAEQLRGADEEDGS